MVPDWPEVLSCFSVILNIKRLPFNSQAGHSPGLRVQSPVGVCTGRQPIPFVSHIDVSLPLSKGVLGQVVKKTAQSCALPLWGPQKVLSLCRGTKAGGGEAGMLLPLS